MEKSFSAYRKQYEQTYSEFNRRKYVEPDPLQFLYGYPELRDREIAGIIAASLAFGNVRQIIKSVAIVLEKIQSPYLFVRNSSLHDCRNLFADFKYRFVDGDDVAALLVGIKSVLDKFSSLEACFLAGMGSGDKNLLGATEYFVRNVLKAPYDSYLLTLPSRGSACKRINLYLRWMIRADEVDPGGWKSISPSKLIIPVDTHMWKICSQAGFTKRKHADLKSALEITDAFRAINPEDPVKYDFSLTRAGIRRNIK